MLVDLDFGRDELRLSVSDDGVGLPDDYEGRGHGFENMRAYAETSGRTAYRRTQGFGRGRERDLRDADCLAKNRRDRLSTESRRIRVLLADDHAVTREGLQVMLERSEEFEVVGQARDGVEAVKAASELSPDVIVMDVMMPKKDGVEACREIMESLPETRVIMLTA